MWKALVRSLSVAGLVAASGVAGLLGYHLVRAGVTEEVYRSRLRDLAEEYEALRGRYNEAVRRTAVTELAVEDGRLSVRVRNAQGVVAEIPTPYDPRGEIYVDFAIVDGRLWIRRVFDALTPPSKGTVIDPALAEIDWDRSGALYGQAVYRSLGEGRWVVSVSGDGSLGLVRAPEGAVELAPAPQVGGFAEIEEEVSRELERVGPAAIWRRLVGVE